MKIFIEFFQTKNINFFLIKNFTKKIIDLKFDFFQNFLKILK